MKLEFNLSERRYLYALMKLFAHNEKEAQAKMFWADLANRLGPNQTTAHLRRKEVQLILDVVDKAVHTIDGSIRSKAKDLGQEVRADVLKQILAGAKARLAEKLAETPNEEKENGI